MAKEALNKVRYRQFAQKCRGARVNKVVVNRNEQNKKIIYQYNARALKGGKRFNGQWIVDKNERSEDELKSVEDAFLNLLREDFMISKGTGFAAAKDEAEESSAAS